MYVDPPWPYRSGFRRDVITEGDDLCDPKHLDIGEHDSKVGGVMKMRGSYWQSIHQNNPGRGNR